APLRPKSPRNPRVDPMVERRSMSLASRFFPWLGSRSQALTAWSGLARSKTEPLSQPISMRSLPVTARAGSTANVSPLFRPIRAAVQAESDLPAGSCDPYANRLQSCGSPLRDHRLLCADVD